MLERIRRLHISLAAKCQLLFGAAVVLIIAAALLVPWQRMEQLTEQLNDAAASAVADSAVRHHVATAAGPGMDGASASGRAIASTGPSTAPIAATQPLSNAERVQQRPI